MSATQNASTPPEPVAQAGGVLRTVALALSDIKIAHSVFALPFALLAAVLAATDPAVPGRLDWRRLLGQLALIVVCMVTGRTWAMLVNRIVDRGFDAGNPRTARRAIASGRLPVRSGVMVAAGCAVLFCAGCALFWWFFANPWPLVLSLPVLAWIAFYSFTKRFTAWCHVFLGGALAASPLAAALAINPAFLGGRAGLAVWFIGAMVVCWVAGFDAAYALQDIEFDRAHGLHSIPARVGVSGALWLGRALHLAAAAFLVTAVEVEPRFGWLMRAGAAVAIATLIVEHMVLARRGVAGLPLAFFTLNGVVSLTLGAAGIADVLLRPLILRTA